MGDGRPDHEVVAVDLEPVEAGDPTHVDQHARAPEAQRHQRQQALTPGQHLGVLTGLDERGDAALDGVRCDIGERWRLHPRPPSGSSVRRAGAA